MKKIISLISVLVVFVSFNLYSQTILIDPIGDGGFENGTSFSDNGWTVVNGSSSSSDYNRWVVGTSATPTDGTYCAYISSGNTGNYGTSANYEYNYSGNSSSDKCHIYRDITFPAGEELITLSFEWKSRGYWSDNSDYMRVYLIPTSITPTEDVSVDWTYRIGDLYYNHNTVWQNETITLDPAYAGTTYRLVFSWINDASGNTNPPAAIDEISLTSESSDMNYNSCTTSQASTSSVCPGTLNNEIICIQVVTDNGLANPLSAESFTFNTGGNTSNTTDIDNAKLYYTGTNNTFSTASQVGSTYNSPSGNFTITTSQTLALGSNYFWLTYDVSNSSGIGNTIDCECNSIIVSSVSQTPSTTDPAGSRNIPSGCPPGNDDCSNAWDIPLNTDISGSNVDAATSIQADDPNPVTEASCNSSADNVVFFKFTTSNAGDYQLCFSNLSCNTINGIQASIFDTDLCHSTHNWPTELACEEPMNTGNFCVNAAGLQATTTYMIAVDGYSGCECDWDMRVDEITLPVGLSKFSAKTENCMSTLSWCTLSETNNDYFSIYRKTPEGLKLINTIQGMGNSLSLHEYKYVDKHPVSGLNYYYLYQTDYDGTTQLIGVRSTKINCTEKQIRIIQNENSLEFHSTAFGETISINIYNSSGILYKEFIIQESYHSIDTQTFPTGMYIISASSNSEISTQKIFIR